MCWQNWHTHLTVFRNKGILLQKYQYYASILSDHDTPDIYSFMLKYMRAKSDRPYTPYSKMAAILIFFVYLQISPCYLV